MLAIIWERTGDIKISEVPLRNDCTGYRLFQTRGISSITFKELGVLCLFSNLMETTPD